MNECVDKLLIAPEEQESSETIDSTGLVIHVNIWCVPYNRMYNLIWIAVSCSAGGADNTYRWVIPSARSTIPITIYWYRRLIIKCHVWMHKRLLFKVTRFSFFQFYCQFYPELPYSLQFLTLSTQHVDCCN